MTGRFSQEQVDTWRRDGGVLIERFFTGEEAAAVKKEFDAAFAKVLAAKNPSGETYQSRIDAGKLPGSVNEK